MAQARISITDDEWGWLSSQAKLCRMHRLMVALRPEGPVLYVPAAERKAAAFSIVQYWLMQPHAKASSIDSPDSPALRLAGRLREQAKLEWRRV